MPNHLQDNRFGVYLFGSHQNGDALPESDVDLLMFVHPELPMQRFLSLQDEVLKENPQWKDLKFDIQIILCQEKVPQKVQDATAFALAQQGAQIVYGREVAKQCYQMTWDDYWKAMKFEARRRIRQAQAMNFDSLKQHFLTTRDLKFLLSMAFTVQACFEMRMRPGTWLLSPTEIQNPNFIHMRETVRRDWKYRLPSHPAEQQTLDQYFEFALSLAEQFMKNWG